MLTVRGCCSLPALVLVVWLQLKVAPGGWGGFFVSPAQFAVYFPLCMSYSVWPTVCVSYRVWGEVHGGFELEARAEPGSLRAR